MTGLERELYERAILDCVAVADTMLSTQALRPIVLGVAELLAKELRVRCEADAQPRPRRSRVTRGHLHAVPTAEGA